MDSRTCNVCSAPCSSCTHRNAGFTGSKSDESSNENGHGVAGSQCSVSEDRLLPSNNAASEASNLVSSSHDALSANAESRETVRRSGISYDSGAVATTSKTSFSGSRMKHKVSSSANVLDQSSTRLEGQEDGILSERERLGPQGDTDKEGPSGEGSTPSGQNGKDVKSSKSASFNNSDESVSTAMSESDSEMVLHDVKVCDICGDAGREDLLAICTGCSDGAEHIYCMRERLNAVPEGDWFCEECQSEAEKQKQEAKRKRETEVILSPHSSGKRHADKIEAAPDAKRQAVEDSTGSPKKPVLPRIGALSRETSFKGLDSPRGKLSHQSSFTDKMEGARSTGSQLQPPKGLLILLQMADKRVGKRSTNQRGFSKMDSGICNVCSAPCSSCTHRNVGFTGSKSDESSDENGHGVAGSQFSVNEDRLLPSNNTASEASNLVNSTHDALSENAESRETIRRSGISDDSGAVAMTSKTSFSGSRMKHKGSASANVLDQSSTRLEGQEDVILSERERLGPQGDTDKEEPSVEGSTPSSQNGKDVKSSKSASFNNSDESVSTAMSESESDSEMVLHDVKVCDICGDAGREDLLAICTGCSDGAEHIYCMRERLNAVPEGDWLCEECQTVAEKQKQEAKRKRETEVILSPHSSGKRHADKIEAAPDAKRQAVEDSTGSPKKPVLPRIGALSRETSFKGLDSPRGKLSQQSSFTDKMEGARSTGSQLHPPKGGFLKSSSFNSSSTKPKVQLMDDDVILPRKKIRKDSSLGNLSKSMSSKTTDTGSSNGNDSQAKMLASKFYHSQEGKSPKQLKDRSTEANAPAASTDQKLSPRSSLGSSYANSTRDSKGLQSDGKRGSLTKQVSNLNRNRLESPVTCGSDIPTNGKCNAREESSSQADCENELLSTSCAGEVVPSKGNVASQDRLPRSREFREVGKKSREASGKRQRSSLLSDAKGLPSSQKERQTAESNETSGVSDSDLPTPKNAREDINKGNRLRAAVDAALRKKPSFGKNRVLEQLLMDPDARFEYDLTGIYEIHKYTLREYLARFKGMILTCNGLGISQSSSLW
ncbi:hypothetical protein F2Q69_00000698 [Brassica cretica]|uniref:PHD-type domain-containing protein n=1 Tax=Brassica cretica TaxID=69181 RepID=A0A8S9P5S6_BRACR|nr:hypothetical protein F2Q69_00000698 [Brassica cretica]